MKKKLTVTPLEFKVRTVVKLVNRNIVTANSKAGQQMSSSLPTTITSF